MILGFSIRSNKVQIKVISFSTLNMRIIFVKLKLPNLIEIKEFNFSVVESPLGD